MKYYKLEYDMNRPSTKCLPVPTNSDYGVAVKVFRNGELVNGDLSVGGLSAMTRGDWKLVDLSSGSDEGIAELPVEIGGENTVSFYDDDVKTYTTVLPFPETYSMQLLTLGSTPELSGLTELPVDWVKTFEVEYVLSSASTVSDPVVAPTEKTNLVTNLGSLPQPPVSFWIEDGKWHSFRLPPQDVVELSGTTMLELTDNKLNNQMLSAHYTIDIDSGDGVNGKFKLLVSNKKMGYIEIEPTEEQQA